MNPSVRINSLSYSPENVSMKHDNILEKIVLMLGIQPSENYCSAFTVQKFPLTMRVIRTANSLVSTKILEDWVLDQNHLIITTKANSQGGQHSLLLYKQQWRNYYLHLKMFLLAVVL